MATKFVPSLRGSLVRAVAALALLLPLCVAAPARSAAQGVSQTGRVLLATRALPASSAAADSGVLPALQRLNLTLTLSPTPDRAAALDSFLDALTTPGSASYHQWLTPAQFAGSYGATPDQLAAATAWAQAQGLSVDAVSPSGLRLSVSGTATQVQAAFAVTLHSFQVGTKFYSGNIDEPSLPGDAAAIIAGVDGLVTAPAAASIQVSAYQPQAGAASALDTFSALATLVDANATAYLALSSSACVSTLSASELAEYTAAFRQAAAQGISTFSANSCTTGAFPSALAQVTALNLSGAAVADTGTALDARPGWQSAPGLPGDSLRHIPDLAVSSLADFSSTMASIAGNSRLGNINPVLYELAPEPGLYAQPDAAPAGTWEAGTGLGVVDLHMLATVYPRGTGMSYTSFQATNYSPIHGQGTSFTSSVTSGTGGATPTGTVSFVTSAGVTLGTATLVNGTASLTLTNLEGGNLTVYAQYSGDPAYATSKSPTAQLYVQPEPSTLSATISGSPTIGGSYTVTVTDTAPSGVGQPAGPISVTISGTSNVYTATLQPAGTGSSSASFSIPATTAGTITLMITCTGSADYSCYNPYTTTVTISKATPTLSISYSPNPPVSGQSLSLNAVVSTVGTAPAPTGAVTFYDNGTTLNASQLTNGSTSTTGTVPTTATHAITATYAGDPNYNSVSTNASSSSSGTITTALGLQASTSTVTVGQPITFTATLSAASTGPASPTGTVTFLDGGTQIGTANLANGTIASFTTSSLSATANHSITAVYSGDGYYSASTSSPVGLGQSTSGNTSTVTLTESSAIVQHGQYATFTATVAGPAGGSTPAGTITFTDQNAGVLGTATVSNGVAIYTTNKLSGGGYNVTASYGGSTVYNPSSSAAVALTVTQEPTTLSIGLPANPVFGQALQVTLSIVASSGVGSPSGSVTLTPSGNGYSGTLVGTVTGSTVTSTGTAVVTVQATAAGALVLTATYSGDRSFAAAGPVTITGTISKASTSTALTFIAAAAGQPTTFTATVTSTSGTLPTGTVQFNDTTTGKLLGTGTVGANGIATITSTLATGNHVVTAVYSGDANNAASTSVSVSTTTGTVPTTIAISPTLVTSGTVSQPTTLSATVTANTGSGTPTGSVQFIAGGTVLCTANLAAGVASCTYTPLAVAGATSLTAVYSGDPTYAASTSVPVTIYVNAGSGSLVATLTPASAAGGSVASVTAVVTAPAGTIPSGSISATVVPRAGGANISSNTVIIPAGTSNVATASVPVMVPATAGLYEVVVSCVNTNFTCFNSYLDLTSISGTTNGKITTTTVLTATASSTTTGATTLTAAITPVTVSTALPTGTVIFYDGTVPVAVATVSSGAATASVTLSTATTHSLTAVYSGDTLYAGSTSAAVTGTSTSTGAATPVIVLTSNASSGVAGGNVVLTASVAGLTSTGSAPTGTVSFYTSGTGGRLLGTATLGTTGSGVATAVLSTNSIPAGAQTVYAVYTGDTNFAIATSNSISVGVTDFGLQFTPATLTLSPGDTEEVTTQLTAVNGFTASVALGCVPPSGEEITCSFSPAVLTAGGSSVLTVKTTKVQLMGTPASGQHASLKVAGGLSFAALLCFLLPRRRMRAGLLLLALVALSLNPTLGCAANNGAFGTDPVVDPGTPLGTTLLTITATSTDGVNFTRHTYQYQVTVQ